MKDLNLPFSGLLFDEEEHRYYYEGRTLKSVTTLLKETLFADKYSDVDPKVLAEAAKFGTTVHKMLEIDDPSLGDLVDIMDSAFGNDRVATSEIRDKVMDVYNASVLTLNNSNVNRLRHEYLVTDGTLAGSIDLIADVNGESAIVDYKFTYNADIEYLSWQESIYAYLFEKMTGQHIDKLYALWIPKRDASLGWFNPIPRKTNEEIENLINGSITSKDDSYPVAIKEAQMALAEILVKEKEIAERKNMLQATLHQFMEENGVKQIKSDYYTISYVAATTRKSLDTAKLAKAHPEINLDEYQKISNAKSTVKILIK